MATYNSDGNLDTATVGVRARLAGATTGDIITMPAGTFNWNTGPLVLTKAVTIQGAGPNSTHIQCGSGLTTFQIDGGSAGTNWPDGTHPRICFLTVQYDDVAANPANGWVRFSNKVNEFRIDHVDFRRFPHSGAAKAGSVIRVDANFWGWGVIDHCHVDSSINGDVIESDQPAWVPLSGTPFPTKRDKGDGSWADGPHWAEGKAFRFEDCIFETNPFILTTLSGGGARREIRYCSFNEAQTAGHGAETNHSGGRSTEYYNNAFKSATLQAVGPYNSRSSASIVFNNRAINCNKIDRITAYRMSICSQCYGSPDGANPFDLNKKGNFSDKFGNAYTVATVDNAEGHGDIYWQGTYSGATIDNLTGSMNVTGLTGLTGNGSGPRSDLRWVGFQLRNKSLATRILNGDRSHIETGSIISASTSSSLTVVDSVTPGTSTSMQIVSGDVLEIRCVDVFIHQPGRGKGDLLESWPNHVNDTDSSAQQTTKCSFNVTKGNKRLYPNDPNDSNDGVEGLWFWGNKCTLSTNGDYQNCDVVFEDPTASGPFPCIGMGENPQQMIHGRDVFNPGRNNGVNLPLADPSTTSGRPTGYPYNATASGISQHALKRIGADQDAFDTFSYYGATWLTNLLPVKIASTSSDAALAVWGRAYPDYLISVSPQINSVSTTSFTVGQSNSFTITTANFTGTPVMTIGAWSPTTPPNVTFTDLGNGTATLAGTASGASAGTYTVTLTATSGAQVDTQSFALVIITPNVPPTVTLDSPANSAVFTAPATITLSATATDSGAGFITKVEFYRGGSTLIATVTSAPYSYIWTSVAAGSYSLTAKAYDDGGGITTSSPANSITVNAAPALQAPSIVVSA